ncbi:hypothetical protein EFY79_08250 [Hanamia caeni]|uniref:DUF6799 domain-containing protein n=2 Tax=Hanamia caeni TaxID=2294116 RepID=A0A3M9NHU7_9BACT|nr:hypothetical protein EFY79_08250 [Hanamia caeni]
MIGAALSFGAFAQDSTGTSTTSPTEQTQQQQKDMYVFKNSKMWTVKNGNIAAMANDVTLSDGTVVKTTGEITKNGKTEALKDGQYIDADGNIGETTEK